MTPFKKAKHEVADNLKAIQSRLEICVSEGMLDEHADHYNQILDLLDDLSLLKDKDVDSLEEVVLKAKTLETEVAVWLSYHGRASLSFDWPTRAEMS